MVGNREGEHKGVERKGSEHKGRGTENQSVVQEKLDGGAEQAVVVKPKRGLKTRMKKSTAKTPATTNIV